MIVVEQARNENISDLADDSGNVGRKKMRDLGDARWEE